MPRTCVYSSCPHPQTIFLSSGKALLQSGYRPHTLLSAIAFSCGVIWIRLSCIEWETCSSERLILALVMACRSDLNFSLCRLVAVAVDTDRIMKVGLELAGWKKMPADSAVHIKRQEHKQGADRNR